MTDDDRLMTLTTPTTDELLKEAARIRADAEAAQFERDLALERERRAAEQVRRLELRQAEIRAELSALRARLDERERYLAAIHHSGGWRALQRLRQLVGRRW
jgi:hypothetical protein